MSGPPSMLPVPPREPRYVAVTRHQLPAAASEIKDLKRQLLLTRRDLALARQRWSKRMGAR
jgi:hypothetical protein